MTKTQLENLYIFYFLYNGSTQSCDLMMQSPDYLLEKFEKLIGIPATDTKYPELQDIKLYQEWNKRWMCNGENPIPENVMIFLVKTHPKENNGNYLRLMPIVEIFEKYIGKTCNITKEEYKHIHPVIIGAIQDFIKRTIKYEDLRDIKLNNLLS